MEWPSLSSYLAIESWQPELVAIDEAGIRYVAESLCTENVLPDHLQRSAASQSCGDRSRRVMPAELVNLSS